MEAMNGPATSSARWRLPKRRRSTTYAARVNGHRVYVTLGEYSDGVLGEMFLDMHKVGSFSRGVLHCFAKLFSIALQYGVPLNILVKTFRGVQFAPSGDVTGHDSITAAQSIIDYAMQVLELAYPDKVDKLKKEEQL